MNVNKPTENEWLEKMWTNGGIRAKYERAKHVIANNGPPDCCSIPEHPVPFMPFFVLFCNLRKFPFSFYYFLFDVLYIRKNIIITISLTLNGISSPPFLDVRSVRVHSQHFEQCAARASKIHGNSNERFVATLEHAPGARVIKFSFRSTAGKLNMSSELKFIQNVI